MRGRLVRYRCSKQNFRTHSEYGNSVLSYQCSTFQSGNRFMLEILLWEQSHYSLNPWCPIPLWLPMNTSQDWPSCCRHALQREGDPCGPTHPSTCTLNEANPSLWEMQKQTKLLWEHRPLWQCCAVDHCKVIVMHCLKYSLSNGTVSISLKNDVKKLQFLQFLDGSWWLFVILPEIHKLHSMNSERHLWKLP